MNWEFGTVETGQIQPSATGHLGKSVERGCKLIHDGQLICALGHHRKSWSVADTG